MMTTDPFTGVPLVYKVKAGSSDPTKGAAYELYSAGPGGAADSGGFGPIFLPRQ